MKLFKISLTCILFFSVSLFYGQAGSLDPSFGNDGIVVTPNNGDDDGEAILEQPDGKIVVAGSSNNGDEYDLVVHRYNSDGSLDITFGSGGIVTTNIGQGSLGTAMALQTDGKIVIAGTVGTEDDFDVVVVRFHADGSLDDTFGANGVVITTDDNANSGANAIILQNDGKIVIAGINEMDDEVDIIVIRYNDNGSLDNSFGTAGIVLTDISSTINEAESIVLQSDGKIVVAGSVDDSNDFGVVRYNTDGSIDTSFGIEGIVITDIDGGSDQASDMVIQDDGKILVIGSSEVGEEPSIDFSVVRYNIDGTLDNTFGTNGVVTIPMGDSEDIGTSIALQFDGKIVVAGDILVGGESVFAIARLNVDGTLDNSFSEDGKDFTAIDDAEDLCNNITIQADGKILLVGESDSGNENSDIAILRYHSGINIGVHDFSIQNNDFLVYPNPTENELYVQYSLLNDDVLSINLFDSSGKLVDAILTKENKLKGSHEELIRLNSSLTPGNYFLTLSNSKGSLTLKIVKN